MLFRVNTYARYLLSIIYNLILINNLKKIINVRHNTVISIFIYFNPKQCISNKLIMIIFLLLITEFILIQTVETDSKFMCHRQTHLQNSGKFGK